MLAKIRPSDRDVRRRFRDAGARRGINPAAEQLEARNETANPLVARGQVIERVAEQRRATSARTNGATSLP